MTRLRTVNSNFIRASHAESHINIWGEEESTEYNYGLLPSMVTSQTHLRTVTQTTHSVRALHCTRHKSICTRNTFRRSVVLCCASIFRVVRAIKSQTRLEAHLYIYLCFKNKCLETNPEPLTWIFIPSQSPNTSSLILCGIYFYPNQLSNRNSWDLYK